jgi:hypothetical protein
MLQDHELYRVLGQEWSACGSSIHSVITDSNGMVRSVPCNAHLHPIKKKSRSPIIRLGLYLSATCFEEHMIRCPALRYKFTTTFSSSYLRLRAPQLNVSLLHFSNPETAAREMFYPLDGPTGGLRTPEIHKRKHIVIGPKILHFKAHQFNKLFSSSVFILTV